MISIQYLGETLSFNRILKTPTISSKRGNVEVIKSDLLIPKLLTSETYRETALSYPTGCMAGIFTSDSPASLKSFLALGIYSENDSDSFFKEFLYRSLNLFASESFAVFKAALTSTAKAMMKTIFRPKHMMFYQPPLR